MSCYDRKSLGFIAEEMMSLYEPESTCGEQCTRMELFFAERWDGTKGRSHAPAALGKLKRP